LGYAYVNFHNHSDGERALEALNYTEIKDRACRIMWSQRDPSLRKDGSGNIFIKNLDPSIDNKALHDTFAAFGNILSCKVAPNENGESLGYGYVHYETREAADLAIENVNGMLLNDTKVFVGHHVSRHERQKRMAEQRSQFTNLYVKFLAPEIDDAELDTMFSKYGEITSAIVQRDEEDVSRGFGFVNFKDHEDASKALDGLHESEYKGQTLFVSRAQKKAERNEELRSQYEQSRNEKLSKYQGVNLYVKNFEDDVDDDKLRQEFAPYGVITSAKVMRDEKGQSRGFGFVCFTAPDEASKAIAEMNNRILGNKPLYVALAQRRDQRRQQIEATKRQWQGVPQMGAPVFGAPIYYPPGYAPPRGMYQNPRPVRWQGAQAPIPGQYPMPSQYPAPGQYPVPSNGVRPARPRNSRQAGNRGGYAARGGRGGYRGNSRTAQQTSAQPQEASQADAPAADVEQSASVLTAASLASMEPEEQKQVLGEALYPLIAALEEEAAPKITGMLLEMDNGELLHLIENPEALKAKVVEAIEVLKEETTE
ncbi:Protein phosphatase PP2A regulatory subunit B, partial [Kickxella alabastrina]